MILRALALIVFVMLAGHAGRGARGLTAAARPLVWLGGQILACRLGLSRPGAFPPAASGLGLLWLDGPGPAEVGGRATGLAPAAGCGLAAVSLAGRTGLARPALAGRCGAGRWIARYRDVASRVPGAACRRTVITRAGPGGDPGLATLAWRVTRRLAALTGLVSDGKGIT